MGTKGHQKSTISLSLFHISTFSHFQIIKEDLLQSAKMVSRYSHTPLLYATGRNTLRLTRVGRVQNYK